MRKRILCSRMPNTVAKLADYGIRLAVSNEYDSEGIITDYFIIDAACDVFQWEAAMLRTPQWYPITLE